MKIITVSDTHGFENKIKVPECDILIHAGDYDINTLSDLERLNKWFGEQPSGYNICIAGNHDFLMERMDKRMINDVLCNAWYLEDDYVHAEGVKIYGSPWTPTFGRWAFMKNHNDIKEVWDQIPEDTDILVTHGPPFGIMDYASYMSVGCPHLRDKVKILQPKIHVFGHIHENYGAHALPYVSTDFYNVALMTNTMMLEYPPREIDYES